MQVIYIDVLFMINMIMDAIIFFTASIIIGKKIKKVNLVIGSIIAALLYCLGVYFPALEKLPFYLYYFLIPIIPIIYIFKPQNRKEFLKQYVIAFAISFLIGGATFNCYYLVGESGSKGSVRMMLPLAVGGALAVIIALSSQYIKERLILPQFEYDVVFKQCNKVIKTRGFVDTGNVLYTSSDSRPVIVIAHSTIEPILTKQQVHIFEMTKEEGVISVVSKAKEERAYCIPFMSVGCEEGILLGLEIETMVLKKGKYMREFKEVVIGLCEDHFMGAWAYDVLIHPQYITLDKEGEL